MFRVVQQATVLRREESQRGDRERRKSKERSQEAGFTTLEICSAMRCWLDVKTHPPHEEMCTLEEEGGGKIMWVGTGFLHENVGL